MKKLLVLTVMIAVSAISTQAAVVYWVSDHFSGGEDGNYTNGLCWSGDGGVNPYGTPPLSTDSHGLIGTWGGTVMPIINTVIPAGNVPQTLGIGWDVHYGELNIVNGGSITIGETYIGYHSTGTVHMSGGYMVGGPVELGLSDAIGGTGTVNLTGGTLHLGSINWNNGVLNLSNSAFFLINGDQTGLDLIGNGLITAPAGETVAEHYNVADARTEYRIKHVIVWGGNALPGGDGDYANGNSWSDNLATSYGSPPLYSDTRGVIKDTYTSLMPTISSAIGQAPWTLCVGWDGDEGELNMDSGSITAHDVFVGHDVNNEANGVLNIDDGYMTIDGGLHMSTAANVTGMVNMTGGTLYMNSVAIYSGPNSNGRFNLWAPAKLALKGDRTGEGFVDTYIFAPGTGDSVVETYNSTDDQTEWTVVPEPGTLGLIAILGLAFLRRK